MIIIVVLISSTTIFAQKNKQFDRKEKTPVQAIYTCPMHPEVYSLAAGKCPICSRTLVLSGKEQMKMEVMKYSCPMHPDMVSDKAGKCPVCGMTMEERKKKSPNSKTKS
nr:heavy metal-binding domain-containing protein [Segetibacter koreensis]